MIWVYDRKDEIMEYVSNGLRKYGGTFEPCTTLGISDDNGELLAGFIFHNYDEELGNIEISAYAKDARWSTKDKWSRILYYPFEELKVRQLIAITSKNNVIVNKIAKALNACRTILPKYYSDDEDGIYYTVHNNWWETIKTKKR